MSTDMRERAGVGLAAPAPTDRPRPDGSDIRKLTAADVPAVSQTLALAFYDDPHMRWVFQNDGKRLSRLERLFTMLVRGMWLDHDAGYTHEQFAGAAVWMPPRTWFVSPVTQLRLTPELLRAARGDVFRLLRVHTFMERKHPRRPFHWYLPVIGVTPPWQGRGFGQALLAPMLERCDLQRVPAYLEASNARSKTLYERNGFTVLERCTYAPDGPPMWLMWREPAAR